MSERQRQKEIKINIETKRDTDKTILSQKEDKTVIDLERKRMRQK